MTVKDRKRVNRLKHLLILLGFVELGLLIACIRATKTDEFDVPTYGFEDIRFDSYGQEREPDNLSQREQAVRDAENRNSAMMGLGANPNEIIP